MVYIRKHTTMEGKIKKGCTGNYPAENSKYAIENRQVEIKDYTFKSSNFEKSKTKEI